jgi:hypothetical protein
VGVFAAEAPHLPLISIVHIPAVAIPGFAITTGSACCQDAIPYEMRVREHHLRRR